MTRALIVNAYAVGNRGDAAIVEGVIATARRAGATYVDVAPSVLDPESEWRELGADAVTPALLSLADAPGWMRRSRVLLLCYVAFRSLRMLAETRRSTMRDPTARAYANATVVISAGGAYLGGPKPGINFVQAMNIAYARMLGRPALVAPITVNPPSWLVGRILRWGLRDALVFVRDTPSRDQLAELGVPSTLVPDVAVRAPTVRRASAAARDVVIGESDASCLCWAPRLYRPDQDAWPHRTMLERNMVDGVAEFLRRTGFGLRFVPQVVVGGDDDDRLAVARLTELFPDDLRSRIEHGAPASSVAAAVDQFVGCRVLLASRLHASILAMALGVPSLSVAYEPKVAGVLDDLGLSDRVLPVEPTWTPSDLANRLLRLMEPDERARTFAAFAVDESRFEALDRALRDGLSG